MSQKCAISPREVQQKKMFLIKHYAVIKLHRQLTPYCEKVKSCIWGMLGGICGLRKIAEKEKSKNGVH